MDISSQSAGNINDPNNSVNSDRNEKMGENDSQPSTKVLAAELDETKNSDNSNASFDVNNGYSTNNKNEPNNSINSDLNELMDENNSQTGNVVSELGDIKNSSMVSTSTVISSATNTDSLQENQNSTMDTLPGRFIVKVKKDTIDIMNPEDRHVKIGLIFVFSRALFYLLKLVEILEALLGLDDFEAIGINPKRDCDLEEFNKCQTDASSSNKMFRTKDEKKKKIHELRVSIINTENTRKQLDDMFEIKYRELRRKYDEEKDSKRKADHKKSVQCGLHNLFFFKNKISPNCSDNESKLEMGQLKMSVTSIIDASSVNNLAHKVNCYNDCYNDEKVTDKIKLQSVIEDIVEEIATKSKILSGFTHNMCLAAINKHMSVEFGKIDWVEVVNDQEESDFIKLIADFVCVYAEKEDKEYEPKHKKFKKN